MVKQVLKPIKKLHTVDWAGDGDVVPWHKSHDITDGAAPVMSVVTYAAVSLNGQRCPCPVHFVPTPWVGSRGACVPVFFSPARGGGFDCPLPQRCVVCAGRCPKRSALHRSRLHC